ncbi:MlaD family protein [Thalassotalea fusca]
MTQKPTPSSPVIEEKEGISAVWLVPFLALLFGGWLLIKSFTEQGVFITVQFDNASGIVKGKTQVRYRGLIVGLVKDVEISDDLQSVMVEIEMDSSSKTMLTNKALFWYVTADFSLQEGVTDLDTLVSGSYINFKPDLESKGEAKREFVALRDAPSLDASTPGLHVVLHTKALGSLSRGSPVTFRQITVGHVSGYRYNEQLNLVKVNVFIKPEYSHLVKENSRFWNASGVEVSGSLTGGIQVKTQSIASIVSGGIAFDDAQHEAVLPPAQNGQVYQLYPDYRTAEMGHEISLELNWDSGIDEGAAIRYQGLTLGYIASVDKIDPQSRRITAIAKVNPRVIPYLTENTSFFVASPQIDLGGVTNLHSLLLGSHIGISPSISGQPTNEFIVYNQKPAYQYDEPGLHLVLQANDVSSIRVNTGIYYKQQRVGSVQAIEHTGPNESLIHIHVEPDYQDYVSTDSRFWNISGFKVTGGLQNFEVNAQSLQSILTGGIAFDLGIAQEKTTPQNGDTFALYDSQKMAKQRLTFQLVASSMFGLSEDARILLYGEEIGAIQHVDSQQGQVVITAGLLPEYAHILKQDSQFWVVNPSISFAGFSDTDALFGGSYIGVNVGKGEHIDVFSLAGKPPKKPTSADGVQLTLNTERGNVVTPGSPISYKGILVGQVDNVAIDEKEQDVDINVTIAEEYRHLLTNQTRFYNASGITIKGGVGNFLIKTESTDAILRGGISFFNTPQVFSEQMTPEPLAEGSRFTLYDNVEYARLAGQAVRIRFNDIDGLKTNLKIKYKEHQVGMVEHIQFDQDGLGATAYAYLSDHAKQFAVSGTQFWLAKPELGLVGSKNVSALIEGNFIGVKPGTGEFSTAFTANDWEPVTTNKARGLNITLTSARLGSIRVGNPVLYRQVKVGEVIGVDLNDTADAVNIYVNIAQRFAPLVTAQSKFWNASGVQLDAGIFSGIDIKSESVETLLAGGIAFATPPNANIQQVAQAHTFKLADEFDEDWLEWRPQIPLNSAP